MLTVLPRLSDVREIAERMMKSVSPGSAPATDMVVIDPVSGLPLAATLSRHLEAVVDAATESGDRYAVTLVEIDGFERLEALAAGALRLVADLCRDQARRDLDLVAAVRPGCIGILHHDIDKAQAMALADKLRRRIADRAAAPSTVGEASVTVTIGIAASSGGDLAPDALLNRARKALDEARAVGRGAVVAV